ncbi:hypothetical protein ACFS7Z_04995 [Pontibacter toksunensis]|uniref:Outer membrane protein beta-barrel domain-containing protein n=1 Tax=Pontibacter toksunensis TaxID=1332631 RepID=A0ABW6BPP6_9BACT
MKLKLLLFLIFCSTVAYAQIQGEKGSLILKNGNILNGKVTYYYDNPNNIILNAHQDAKEMFSPEQVTEIKLENGEKFVAKPYTMEDSIIILQVLLESPKISLFRREDNSELHYYVLKDATLHKLENNDIVVYQETKTYRKKDRKYVGTLSSLMPDRMDLVEKLDKVQLNEHDLTEVILEYNKGDLSYYWKSDNKVRRKPNWIAFTQYSQYGSVLGTPTAGYSSGMMIGLQYYFSKHSRYSFKVSLDYSSYILDDEEFSVKGLGVRYQHDIKKAEKYSFYLLLHVADIAHLTVVNERQVITTAGQLVLLPRFSPGVGFEARPFPRMAVYSEINHLLNLKYFPRSFSLGLKYDFGRTSW